MVFLGISRFTGSGPSVHKGNSKFEILLVKITSLKQEANQIVPTSTEKFKYCLFK